MTDAVTNDRFLGQRLTLRQPARGYRAGIDPALLAAALDLAPGQRVCEFGCGAGAALLSAALLHPDVGFLGIEKDDTALALARHNVEANALSSRVAVSGGDALVEAPPAQFDAVFFNPPFFEDATALRAPSAEKTAAFLAEQPLAEWIAAAGRALKPRGVLTLIHRADRLAETLAGLERARFGSVAIKPVAPREGAPAKRILVQARRGGRAPLRLLAPLLMHDEGEGQYTRLADAVLRGEARIVFDPV